MSVKAGGDGGVAVPTERLLSIARTLPDIDVRAQLVGDRLSLQAGKSQFKLLTLPADTFPAFETGTYGDPVTLDAGAVARALGRVAYAMAKQDVRYYLNGLLLSMEPGRAVLVASDGHRLSHVSVETGYYGLARDFILPREFVGNLIKWLPDGGDVSLLYSSNVVSFQLAAGTLAAKLIDGKYPDWRRIVPSTFAHTVVVDREALRAAVRRVGLITEVSGGITLEITQEAIALTAVNPAGDESADFVSAELSGDAVVLGFNWAYLDDALSHLAGEQVCIQVADGAKSCLLTDPDDDAVWHVVMPMLL